MENQPIPIEPNPSEQAKRYTTALGLLASIRADFKLARDPDGMIDSHKLDLAFHNFESTQIESILNSGSVPSGPWVSDPDDSTAQYIDASADTFIYINDRMVIRVETTQREPITDQQVEMFMEYSLKDGFLQRSISTQSEEIGDSAISHPSTQSEEIGDSAISHPVQEPIKLPNNQTAHQLEQEPPDNIQLDGKQAKEFVDMLEVIITQLKARYEDSNWHIFPDTLHEGDYVIEQAAID